MTGLKITNENIFGDSLQKILIERLRTPPVQVCTFEQALGSEISPLRQPKHRKQMMCFMQKEKLSPFYNSECAIFGMSAF